MAFWEFLFPNFLTFAKKDNLVFLRELKGAWRLKFFLFKQFRVYGEKKKGGRQKISH